MNSELKVYIFDDNRAATAELKNCIEGFLQKHGCYASFRCFEEPKQVEELLKNGHIGCDIFFKDIELGLDVNGIELADMVSRMEPEIKIVFVTGYADRYSQAIFMQSPALRPFGYVTKPIDRAVVERIHSLLIKGSEEAEEKRIEFSKNRRAVSINLREVMYIESWRRKLIFHMRDGAEEEVYAKISEITDRLPDGFSQCHRSYIANLKFVRSVDEKKGEVKMVNGRDLFLGKTKKDSFMEDFFRYKGGI